MNIGVLAKCAYGSYASATTVENTMTTTKTRLDLDHEATCRTRPTD